MNAKELKQAIRETKREMKDSGIRRTSCFNGGLSAQEYSYNARLFELETLLKKAKEEEKVTLYREDWRGNWAPIVPNDRDTDPQATQQLY